MTTPKAVTQKPGRPATGHDPILGVRVPAALVEQVVAWGAARGLSRSEAVRAALQAGVDAGRGPVAPKVVAQKEVAKPTKGKRFVGFDATTGEELYR